MTSIDPLRRLPGVRRPRKPADEAIDAAHDAESANLPVPVSPARTIPPASPRLGGEAALHAQLIGERRGLRAGPSVHDEAKDTYSKTEWSGSQDRRRPKGRAAKTEV